AAGDEGGHRQHAAAGRLAQDQSVGRDGPVVEGGPGASPAQARLPLVEDQQHAGGVADAAPTAGAARRGDDVGGPAPARGAPGPRPTSTAAARGVIARSTAARSPNATARKPGVNGPKPSR